MAKMLSDLLLFSYFCMDHPLYLHKIGMINLGNEFFDKLDWWADFTWFLGNILDIMSDIVEL